MAAWMLGSREIETATVFMKELASRLKNRVQLTTDGHNVYLEAVGEAFGQEIDYAQLVKVYGTAAGERVYAPVRFLYTKKRHVSGKPDMKNVSTSFVERQNLTMRMGMRRFTRLTNAFSKKLENHAHAIALHFMYYNFGRIHQTLRVTPAMEAGISDHVWSLEEIALLADK